MNGTAGLKHRPEARGTDKINRLHHSIRLSANSGQSRVTGQLPDAPISSPIPPATSPDSRPQHQRFPEEGWTHLRASGAAARCSQPAPPCWGAVPFTGGSACHPHAPCLLGLSGGDYKIKDLRITDTLWLLVFRARWSLGVSQRSVGDALVARSPAGRCESCC